MKSKRLHFQQWTCFRGCELHLKVKQDRKSRDSFELELNEMLAQEYIDDWKAHTLFFDDDDEEIVPENDMMGIKQPIGEDKIMYDS